MTKRITAISSIISKAAAEAGIGNKESCSVRIIGIDNGLMEFVLDTEWMTVNCYAELESGSILGIMSETKPAVYPKAA